MFIIRVDGGICSQMHFYLIGRFLSEKGYPVKYDLDWFQQYGKDLTGNYVRNFDLLKVFPYIRFCEPSKWEKFFYRRLSYSGNTYYAAQPPVYLGGYYSDIPELYTDFFSKYFYICPYILDAENLEIFQEISTKETPVAVHIRRGDLSGYNSAYGNPVDADYFSKAMKFISERQVCPYYYFFSDEPSWVRTQLVPSLHLNDNYKIISINGSDKGYMDMILISACQHQITSKGSLGKYGGFLNCNPEGKIIVFDDEIERRNWEGKHFKIVFIK